MDLSWKDIIIGGTALFGAITGGIDLFYLRLWNSRRLKIKVEIREDPSRHSFEINGQKGVIQPTYLLKAINHSPKRVVTLSSVGFHKINRLARVRWIEALLAFIQKLLRGSRIGMLQRINIARIKNDIPYIMSDGDFPKRLEPDESFEVRAWGYCELIGNVGKKSEGELSFKNGYFKDQAGNVYECDGPVGTLYIHEMPPFQNTFQ